MPADARKPKDTCVIVPAAERVRMQDKGVAPRTSQRGSFRISLEPSVWAGMKRLPAGYIRRDCNHYRTFAIANVT